MSYLSLYQDVDTPALLVDIDKVRKNISFMQDKADIANVKLRPHTKTHKMPYIAKLQTAAGAAGITVAKLGEAEVMADAGFGDIFIANEIVGEAKLMRLASLNRRIRVIVGVDCKEHVDALAAVFRSEERPITVRIEVEVGENRTGVDTKEAALALARYISGFASLRLEGIFCHEGHTYKAASADEDKALTESAMKKMVDFAEAIRAEGIDLPVVSTGATPSMLIADIIPGITEIRPGTYVFMDAAQCQAIGDYERCAATVLGTVISKPTAERVVLDTGAKALTAQKRIGGFFNTPGNGVIKGSDVRLDNVFDEHGIVLDRAFHDGVSIGDKVEIIPNHICPCVNLYDYAYIVSSGKVLEKVPVSGRGKTQ